MFPRFIAIAGLIAVGKNHFTTELEGLLGYRAFYEPVEENPYLADFYQDPVRWAYPMQEFLPVSRFHK